MSPSTLADRSNGLWGFKPSTKRVPREGMLGVTSVSRISGAIGPVSHSVRDMDLFYRVLFATPSWKHDIKLVNLGWRDVSPEGKGMGFDGWSGEGNKLRVGVMRDDGVVRPVKPIRRAIDAAVAKLEASGVAEVVEFPAQFFEEGWALTVSGRTALCGRGATCYCLTRAHADCSARCTTSTAVRSSAMRWATSPCGP
jgi:Asp-tRNA(Asn)/Glu-tRNA(Gln) amidotransferase A subunit family amidase